METINSFENNSEDQNDDWMSSLAYDIEAGLVGKGLESLLDQPCGEALDDWAAGSDGGVILNPPKPTVNPAKHWCFTLQKPTIKEIEFLINLEVSVVPVLVFQEEIGENGNFHIQGILSFKKKTRPFSIFHNNRYHWEICRHIKESLLYCTKSDTRVQGTRPYCRGYRLPITINIELYDWQEEILAKLKVEPNDREILWYWSKLGNVGKTTYMKWIFLNLPDVMLVSGNSHDIKNGIAMYLTKHNGYPRIVLVDVPRSGERYISYQALEEIKNAFFFSGKYESSMVCDWPPTVLVFANFEPDMSKMSADQWYIKEIGTP